MRLVDEDEVLWRMIGKAIPQSAIYTKAYLIAKEEIAKSPTIEAIPIEWINDYLSHIMTTNKITSVEERSLKMAGIKDMLFVWEHWGKENG